MTMPPVPEMQDVCASDPNFAVIFAFCERFGDNCGITIPTFQELQEMLEKTDEVPDVLVDLHIKLLRRVKKSVHADKWERAILKFSQLYSIPDIWQLESYGYKGISVQLKLRILKTLFEAQFDSNVKFKAEINKLEGSTLRSQPIGWDKSGTAYWVQFDRAYNLRVYKEDCDEDKWKIVAKDRSSLVNLINELSGENVLDDVEDSNSVETGSDAEIELSPDLNQEKLISPVISKLNPINENVKTEYSNDFNIKPEEDLLDQFSKENSIKNPMNLKRKLNEENSSLDRSPIVGETIEESVMIVKGEGSGQDCDTGNPDETNTQNETSKNEDVKKPKLWSIETICSSSKEVQEETIHVPMSGFFFGDNSVHCFNSVSNGESSHLNEKNIEDNSSKKDDKEKKPDHIGSTSTSDESFNIEGNIKNDSELSGIKASKQSVFNIKVHEEEVQITERNANEVFAKTETNLKDDEQKKNICESTSVSESINKSQETISPQALESDKHNKLYSSCETSNLDTDNNDNQNKTNDEHKVISVNKKFECKEIEKNINTDKQHRDTDVSSDLDKHVGKYGSPNENAEKDGDNETVQELETDLQTSKKVDQNIKTDEHVLENDLNINEQSKTQINKNYEIETKNPNCKNDETNELLENTKDQSIETNNHNINVVEQTCLLDKKLTNIDDTSVTINDKTQKKECNVIDDKIEILNAINEDNETDSKISEDVHQHVETIDSSESKVIPSNDSFDQSTETDYLTINKTENKNIIQDQTSININQCIEISKQIKDHQNDEKLKETSHIICNIINTDISKNINIEKLTMANKIDNTDVSKSTETNKQLTRDNRNKIIDTDVSENIKTNEQSTSHNISNIIETDVSTSIEKNEQPSLHSMSNIIETDVGKSNNIDELLISHNISKTMETDINESIKSNEQLANTIISKTEPLENCQISSKNNLVKNVNQEDNNLIVNSSIQIPSNNKHCLDTILQESDEIKEIPKNSKVEIKTVKINTLESEVKTKESETVKTNISTALAFQKDSEQIEEKNSTVLKIPNLHEKQNEIIDKINEFPRSQSQIIDEELNVVSVKQCTKNIIKTKLEIDSAETKMMKSKKEKNKLSNTENKVNTCVVEKLNLEKPLNTSSKQESIVDDPSKEANALEIETPMEVDKENDDILHKEEDKKLVNADEIPKNIENLKNDDLEVDFDTNYEKSKLKNKKIEKEEKHILKTTEEQTVSSPINEVKNESEEETNQETFIDSSKEDFNDSEIIDDIIENDKKNEDEQVPKKKGRPGRKKGKRGRAKKITTTKVENKNNEVEKVKRPYKPRQKKVVTIAEEVTVFPEPASDDNVRRSRRIAEIKIKEQFVPTTHYDDIDLPLKGSKKKDKSGKKGFSPTKKVVIPDEESEEDDDSISKKFKKRKKKGKSNSLKALNTKNPWNVDSESSSSENNVEEFEDFYHEEDDEIPRPGIEPNVSDHEFSPESDINDDDDYLPEKRARTAHKKDQGEQLKDDMPCQKCNKSDQPEWILLCDTCNHGWHASCLRPPLMVIPDDDWYCPPCRHQTLLNALKDTLKKFDGESKKRENEELRRKRLAYVGISLQNVISTKTDDIKVEQPPQKKTEHSESSDDEDDRSESSNDSYDSEPLYQLRARRQANVSYRFNDYDDMINEAILEETGVDESTGKKTTDKAKMDKNDSDENTDSDNDGNNKNDREDSPIAPALLHLRGRKKSKKLTNLDISSDDGSDEDFKGPSEEDDYEEELSEYSDDSVRRQPQPTRRSVRNRKNVVDPDFINDDSSEDSDQRTKKKKRSRPWSNSSNSEEEDFTWGKKKKKRLSAPSSSSFKQLKGSKRRRTEKDSFKKTKKSKIKYGIDSDSDSDNDKPKRRTRGRQITYAESDDSEEEIQPKKRKVGSDDEDEYVLNDDELEAENEDGKLDEEDILEKEDDDDDDDDDDEVVDEEEDEDDDESKPVATKIASTTLEVVKPSILESVIREPPVGSGQVNRQTDFVDKQPQHQHQTHQRLLPTTGSLANLPVAVAQSSSIDVTGDSGSPNKPKRTPSTFLPTKSSPNSIDYGGNYPYQSAADTAAKVSVGPPPQVYNNRPPLTHSAGFKPGTSPTVVAYRSNKFPLGPPASSTYQPPAGPPGAAVSVQQVHYQAPPPANYSYPIDYVVPPPPTVAFRNIAVAPPPQSHETLPLPPIVGLHPPSQLSQAAGDSEFGGLVSYFSSQQEDDFDA